MQKAQVFQLADYRPLTPDQQPLDSKKQRIKDLLAAAEPVERPAKEIILAKIERMEQLLATLIQQQGGLQ